MTEPGFLLEPTNSARRRPRTAEEHRKIQSERLRALAVWYREFAEKTGNPEIWAARLRQAELLEAEALSIARRHVDGGGAGREPSPAEPASRPRRIS